MEIKLFLYEASIDALNSIKAHYRVIGEYELDANVVSVVVSIPDSKAVVLGYFEQITGRHSLSVVTHAFRKEWFTVVKEMAAATLVPERIFVVQKHNVVEAVRSLDLARVIGFESADVVRRIADLSKTSEILERRVNSMLSRFAMPVCGSPFYGGKYANAIKYLALGYEEIAANGYTPKAQSSVACESTAEAVNRRYSEGEEPSFDALIQACKARAWYMSLPLKTDDDSWLDVDVRATLATAIEHDSFELRKNLDRALWTVKWYIDFLFQDCERKSMLTAIGSTECVEEYVAGEKIDVTAAYVETKKVWKSSFSKEGETNYIYSFVLSCGLRAIWKTRVYILSLAGRDLLKGDALTVRATVKDVILDKKTGEKILVLTRAKVYRKGEEPVTKTKKARGARKNVA